MHYKHQGSRHSFQNKIDTWNLATVSGVRRMPWGDSAASSAASLYLVCANNSWKRCTTWDIFKTEGVPVVSMQLEYAIAIYNKLNIKLWNHSKLLTLRVININWKVKLQSSTSTKSNSYFWAVEDQIFQQIIHKKGQKLLLHIFYHGITKENCT